MLESNPLKIQNLSTEIDRTQKVGLALHADDQREIDTCVCIYTSIQREREIDRSIDR